MRGVVEPPKPEKASRLFSRFLGLLILLLLAGVVIWAAVTDQRIGLVESEPQSSLDLEEPVMVEDLQINVVEHQGGPIPVVLLHDVDMAGGAVFDGAVDELPARFRGIVIDLPGFGLSARIPDESSTYTVAGMAEVVATVMEERLKIAAVVVGVGYGGEVASELAVSHPDLVRGLVMVDVDFWQEQTWLDVAEGLPFIGRPITFTFQGAGRLGLESWSPNCGFGGWCPSQEQIAARALATSIEGSTDSLRGHMATLPSSFVPSALDEVTVPVAYVWSTRGSVQQETIDRIGASIADMSVIQSDSWMAHVDSPGSIAEAVETVSP